MGAVAPGEMWAASQLILEQPSSIYWAESKFWMRRHDLGRRLGCGDTADAWLDGAEAAILIGMAAIPGGAEEGVVAEDFFAGTRYSEKVIADMAKGDFHAFPESVTAFQSAGRVTEVVGGVVWLAKCSKFKADTRLRWSVSIHERA